MNKILLILFLIYFILYLHNFKCPAKEEFIPVEALTKFDDIKSTILLTKKVNEIFKKNNITYWIIGGTLLGAVRNKGMITWDDDADIAVLNNMEQKIENCKMELASHNLGLVPIHFGYKIYNLNGRPVKNTLFNYPFLDIFVTNIEGDKIVLREGLGRKLWPKEVYNYNDTFPLKEWEFEDFTLPGPHNPFPLLDKIYPKWRTDGEKPAVEHIGNEPKYYKFNLQPSNNKPYIWILSEMDSVRKHCSKNFDIILLNKDNITKWLPELYNYKDKLKNFVFHEKNNIIKIMLLYKYGGIYIEPNVIIRKDLYPLFNKLKKYDLVKMDNKLLASRPNTIFMGTVLQKQLNSNMNEIDSTLVEFINNENYEYYNISSYNGIE